MRLLLLNAPLGGLGPSPYPATAFLKGFLRDHAPARWPLVVTQDDAAIKTLLELLSTQRLKSTAIRLPKLQAALRTLQGRSRGRALEAAKLIVQRGIKTLAQDIDPGLSLKGYDPFEKSQKLSFSDYRKRVETKRPSYVDQAMDAVAEKILAKHRPDLVGISVPFRHSLYGAFRLARVVRKKYPRAKIILGGAYVSHVFREVKDPGVHDYFDYITLDDGERPLLSILENLFEGADSFCRTHVRGRGYCHDKSQKDFRHNQVAMPCYEGLDLKSYFATALTYNRSYEVFNTGPRAQLCLAHGCYWHRCAFCDVKMDYVQRFDPMPARAFVDRIERVIAETGLRDFHFVDEAAPLPLLRSVATEIIRRKLRIRWHCNVRFEKSLTPELARVLARSGCIMLSGGLEAATDRILKLMNKGITLAEAIRAMAAASRAGIIVHAYLIFGFPSQDLQETINGLEVVRQLFEHKILHSAFWHRFELYSSSEVVRHPQAFGVKINRRKHSFGVAALAYSDKIRKQPDMESGLTNAVFSYASGKEIRRTLQHWFDFWVPAPSVLPDFVAKA